MDREKDGATFKPTTVIFPLLWCHSYAVGFSHVVCALSIIVFRFVINVIVHDLIFIVFQSFNANWQKGEIKMKKKRKKVFRSEFSKEISFKKK